MSEWSDAVAFAIKRSAKPDTGAQAAIEGILGLPLTKTGEKADRCYKAAQTHREAAQRGRERRQKPMMEPGTTGDKKWDEQLRENMEPLAV